MNDVKNLNFKFVFLRIFVVLKKDASGGVIACDFEYLSSVTNSS